MNIKQTKPKITWLPVRRKNKKTGKLSDTVELMKVVHNGKKIADSAEDLFTKMLGGK